MYTKAHPILFTEAHPLGFPALALATILIWKNSNGLYQFAFREVHSGASVSARVFSKCIMTRFTQSDLHFMNYHSSVGGNWYQ